MKRVRICKLIHNNPLPDYIIENIKTKRRTHRLYMKTKKDSDGSIYRQLQEEVKATTSIHKTKKCRKMTQEIRKKKIDKPTLNISGKTLTNHAE